MDYRVSSAGIVVSTTFAFRKIDENTPRNKPILVLSKEGVFTTNILTDKNAHYFKGWAPYPYTPKDL